MEKIKIIIADSHYLSRKGLLSVLNENADFEVLAQAQNSSELINLSRLFSPDLIIIDYSSSNFSLDNIPQIARKFTKCKLLAITDFREKKAIAKSLKTGITSHLLKECEEDEIIEAIYKTFMGERFLCGKIASSLVGEEESAISASCQGLNISEREMEIIALVAEGLSNKEIADKLFLSTHTVTTHRKNIMNKLGVNNTAGLVLFAVRENLISPNHFLFSATAAN